jgi:hypothetical protein
MRLGKAICIAGLIGFSAAGMALAEDATFAASGTFNDCASLGGTLLINTGTGVVESNGLDHWTGCLTILGITTWDHIVGLSRVEVFADGEFQSREAGVGAGRELVTESRAGVGQLLQGSERVAQHGTQVEFPRWLVEPTQGFHIVRIQFEQLTDKALGDLGWSQIHPVQGTKQSEQIQPCGFQSRAKVSGYCGG